jgi:hypothetical protein
MQEFCIHPPVLTGIVAEQLRSRPSHDKCGTVRDSHAKLPEHGV